MQLVDNENVLPTKRGAPLIDFEASNINDVHVLKLGRSSSDVRYPDVQMDDMRSPRLADPYVSGSTSLWATLGIPIR
jgi:hypothetical protein